jgi:hypothetical protein
MTRKVIRDELKAARPRLKEHRRGQTHSSLRMGDNLEIVAAVELSDLDEARALERDLKRKKNPQLALAMALTTKLAPDDSPRLLWPHHAVARPISVPRTAHGSGVLPRRFSDFLDFL